MNSLPGGTVTFLMTDVEQSTRLWEQFPDRMRAALLRHDALAQTCIARHGGILVKPRGEGDSLFAVFERANDAVNAAVDFHNALRVETWDADVVLRVRMALHTGEAGLRDGDYYGATVNRCARIRSVAHGGQILLSQTTADLTRGLLPADARLHDLGTHGLKDLRHPERLSQLLCPDWRDDFPPLRSLDAYRHNLPCQLTSFIGREDEMAQIKTLLADTCLLTLIGSGGSGKTRLALQAGADVIDAYEDGVWLVELAPFSDPDLIAREIVKSLSCREEPGRHALETLCDHLRSKSMLLILDNCEHLVAEAAQAANTLLKACPRLRILATSRIRLNVPGETAWRVPSLLVPDDDARADVDAAMRHASLRLFADRAASAHPQSVVTASNLPAVMQICRRLDGIPLAIELAAARVNTLTVQQIAKRLDKRFNLLVGGSSAVLERHQTLRALIDWSHDLLTGRERVLLRRLAVFTGGWTLEGAEAVCAWGDIAEDDVFELLSRLVDVSLVIADEQEDAHRYRLLETMRQYAQEQLDEVGEDTTARDNHLRYFLDLAEEAEPQLIEATQAQWLQTLEAEHDNLRAALAWAMSGEIRLRLAGALWRFWQMRYITEGRGWLEGALEGARDACDATRAKALNGLGTLVARQGDCETATRLLHESMALRQVAGDVWGTAETLNSLGCVASDQGDYPLAKSLHEQSLNIRRRIGDRWGEAASLNNLGMTMSIMDDYQQAKSYYEQSLSMYRQLQDAARLAGTSANLGMIALNQKEYQLALSLFAESLLIFRKENNKWHIAITCYNIGDALLATGESERAGAFFAESLRLCHDLGDRSGVAYALTGIAKMAMNRNDDVRAAQIFGAVAHLCRTSQISLPTSYQKSVDYEVALLRSRIADQEFIRACEVGNAINFSEIAAFFL